MEEEYIDHRVIQILRWSILIQVIFLTISTFWPRFSFRLDPRMEKFNDWSVVSVILMCLILAILFLKQVEQRMTKRSFLFVLYALALITIVSRYIFLFVISQRFLPPANFSLFRWDAIFFLTIPLVFIAWQYSMQEVLVYSIFIMLAESFPIMLPLGRDNILFAAANALANFARSGIFIIIGWIENRLVTLQRQQHDQLKEANRKLRDYALTSEKLAQTQERNRIARELHDTLAHTLSSTSVQLEAIKALFDKDPSEATKMLDSTLENTKNGLHETRRALADLRSSELESFGLTQSIRNMVQSAAERAGFETEFHLERDLDVLPDAITHCIYRSVQEAVENTIRHANAKNVIVRLQRNNDQTIALTIQDDGRGFEMQSIHQDHLGIKGMKERVEMLGGQFLIDSNKEKGTRINVVLEVGSD